MGLFDTMARVRRAKAAIRDGLAAIRQIRAFQGTSRLDEIRDVQAEIVKMFEAVLKELP